MFNRITHTGVWVTDQDEALAFYRDVLGSFAPPQMDEATGAKVREILAKGYTPPLIFEVDDCRATIARLHELGVDITQEPVEQDYGIDAGIRDPSGNSIRITQPSAPAT
jgi:predicted enzyme related to lactoylglutathione lyase